MRRRFPELWTSLPPPAAQPRRLASLADARAYVDEALRLGRPEPWREIWHRLQAVATLEDAIEAFGDLRELLAEEDLLLPSKQ